MTAEQVARAIVRGAGRAINTGNTRALLRYATNECSNCRAVAKQIEQGHRGGRYAESTGWQVATLNIQERRPNRVLYYGTMDTGSQRLYKKNGDLYRTDPAVTYNYQLLLRKVEAGWKVAGWDIQR